MLGVSTGGSGISGETRINCWRMGSPGTPEVITTPGVAVHSRHSVITSHESYTVAKSPFEFSANGRVNNPMKLGATLSH